MTGTLDYLLTVNSGSSSIKFALFTNTDRPERVVAGDIADIRSSAAVLTVDGAQTREVVAIDHPNAATRVLECLEPHLKGRTLRAIAHRVVHGGGVFDWTCLITQEVIDALTQLIPLAPNHLPDEIALIRTFGQARPGVPQIACFDTAFHRDLPAVSRTLPLPRLSGLSDLRRYGFHGLSYAFLLERLAEIAGPPAASGRVILAHLGSGASLAAVRDRRCVDSSMGFTPAGGLVMSTRSGDLDPGAITYIARARNLTVDQIDELLTRRAGLLGISGRSGDVRDLLAHESTDPDARLAIDVFCYHLKKWIGAFAAALDGLDTLVFAGGIGEHAPSIRARACEGLGFLGLRLDPTRNSSNAPLISSDESSVSVHVVPTDEAVMMVTEARGLLRGLSERADDVSLSSAPDDPSSNRR